MAVSAAETEVKARKAAKETIEWHLVRPFLQETQCHHGITTSEEFAVPMVGTGSAELGRNPDRADDSRVQKVQIFISSDGNQVPVEVLPVSVRLKTKEHRIWPPVDCYMWLVNTPHIFVSESFPRDGFVHYSKWRDVENRTGEAAPKLMAPENLSDVVFYFIRRQIL